MRYIQTTRGGTPVSSAASPKQGDHVFNAIDTAVIRPFEKLKKLRSEITEGEHFVHDYLLHVYSLAVRIAQTPIMAVGRSLVASAGGEEDAIRELVRLQTQYPVLARINASALRSVHQRNADRFGAAAARYEFEVFRAIQQALELAVTPPGARPPGANRSASPGIAFQQMLDNAFDPAAALVVLTKSASQELPAVQRGFVPLIAGLAEALDRPLMWKDPFAGFHEARPTATGRMIVTVANMLLQLEQLKAQSILFGNLIEAEIRQKTRPPQTDAIFGSMLHLIHARLQQLQAGSA